MANQKYVKVLHHGAETWNAWRKTNADTRFDLRDADFSMDILNGANLTGADFTAAFLDGAHFEGADFTEAILTEAHLKGAILTRAILTKANLTKANLTKANLTKANLTQTLLFDTDLSNANLSEARLFDTLLFDTDLSNANLSKAKLYRTNLSRSRLTEANLQKAVLSHTILERAYLEKADLRGASLTDVDLTGADLAGADLAGAKLIGSDLSEANLTGASLDGAYLQGINLTGALFKRTIIRDTIFANVDLSRVQGLNTIRHTGPSTIGIDTLQRSGTALPEVFLRGCGVPQSWIDYLPYLMNSLQPIQFYSCFISYTSHNEDFARRLRGRMQQEGLRVWFAPEDLKGGQHLLDQIDQAIRVYDKLLLVLSDHSLHAKWVINELRRGRTAELAQNRRKLFPIRLMDMRSIEQWECYDRESETDLAAELRAYYIPDFSNWKEHDAFEDAFRKLLNALKAVDEPPAPRDVSALLKRKRRELTVLEKQHAKMGVYIPPHTVIDLEDLQNEIAELERQQNQTGESSAQAGGPE